MKYGILSRGVNTVLSFPDHISKSENKMALEEAPEIAARQNLLDRLLGAVKQCQVHFGARQEIATETDLRVATLCAEWEAVLLYGIKRSKSKGLGRQIAGLVKNDGTASLWGVAKLCLSQEEIQRFLKLQKATSEVGRGRAWLRAAINERTLENYLHCILAEESQLQSLYEPHAFLLDQERSSMLPVMAAGLSSILFSISVDADSLNSLDRIVEVPAIVPLLRIEQASAATILERLPQERGHDDGDDVVAVNVKEKKKKRKKKSSQNNHTISPTPPEDTTTQEGGVATQDSEEVAPQEVGVVSQEGGGAQDSLSSSPSMVSMNSGAEEGGMPMFVALDQSLVSNTVNTEAELAASATALVLSATTSSQLATQVPSGNALSGDEMKEALLAMVKSKDLAEKRRKELESQLLEVTASREELTVELQQSRMELQALQESHITQQQALERENDLLREQLKKYVGIVQAQRKDPSVKLTESSELSPLETADLQLQTTPTLTPAPPNPDQRLSEMAEMYGELMELNEKLHRNVAMKDTIITKLVQCIRQAGMKVPIPAQHLPAAALEQQSLVDVWIPSVFKKGRGPDSFHIYQVFVKVKSDEWNVYRRYAEFREFHKQLTECIPEVSTFNFPPKKAIGSKSSQVVEERRQRLQEYLRFLIRIFMTTSRPTGRRKRAEALIGPSTTKATLIQLLPFFKEDIETEPRKPRSPSYSGL